MINPNGLTQLSAKRWGFIRRATLWDAGEYLLSVNGTRFSERYRRFYYRDMKAIVVQNGPREGSIGALILLILVSIALVVIALTATWPLAKTLWTLPLVALGWMLYLNIQRSCRTFVYTLVSSEELPAVFRRASAQRVLPKILDKIREAQGALNAGTQAAGLAEDSTQPASQFAPLTAAQSEKAPVAAPRGAFYAGLLYFVVMLGSAAFAFWYRDATLTPNSLLRFKIVFSLLNAAGVASGVWAIFKFFRVRGFSGLRMIVFAGLALLGLRAYALYFAFLSIKIEKGSLSETMTWVRLRQWLGAGDCALCILVAISGLILLLWGWQDKRTLAGDSEINSGTEGGSILNL